jgi:hypothetical protein
MTTKEIAAWHEQEAAQSQNLWISANTHVAKICRVQHRARARVICLHFARKFDNMAISCVYKGAARMLKEAS